MIYIRTNEPVWIDPEVILNKLLKELKDKSVEINLLDEAVNIVRNMDDKIENIEEEVFNSLLNVNTFQGLKNWIFNQKTIVQSQLRFEWTNSYFATDVGSNYLHKAQVNWERKMLRSLNSMCQELGIQLTRKRTPKQMEAILQNWTELSVFFNKQSVIKPVFGPKDLLEILISIRHPNMQYSGRINPKDSTSKYSYSWGVINLPLHIKNLHNLRKFFEASNVHTPQIGIDDLFSPIFEQTKEQEAEEIIHQNSSLLAKTFLRSGCPLGYRAQLWALCLNAQITQEDCNYYNNLKAQVAEYECMTDQLVCKEVQLTASNDDMHFVFCDYTYQVLLPFTRDPTVLVHFKSIPASPPRAVGKNSLESMIFPPSGVIPFHGFSMFMLPLCYLYDDPVILYVMFRQFYVRYFHKLHTISDDQSGVVSLCLLFERLLQAKEPQVFFHLRSFGVQPLRFAFKWLMRAFSGFLAPDQVLLLWDRILGYDSLEILPVLAVAIFSYRHTNLLSVNTTAEVEAILADLTTLRVVNLLQMALFTGDL